MKYLLISTNAIGDTYLSATSIKVIRSNDKSAEIDFLSTSVCTPLLELLPLRTIIPVRKNLKELLLVAFRIRKNKYDFVFSFFPGTVNTFFFLISKGCKKGGYINFIRRTDWHNRKQQVSIKGNKVKKLIWTPNNNYIDRVRLPLSVFFNLKISNNFQKQILEIHGPELLIKYSVVLHPFSRSKERALNKECIQRLTDYLETQNEVFIIGQKKDFKNCHVSKNRILCDLNVVTLIKTIISAKLFIAVDSFPIHIADAYNTNFIGLFGPTNPHSVLINYDKAIGLNTNQINKLSFDELISFIDKTIKNKLA